MSRAGRGMREVPPLEQQLWALPVLGGKAKAKQGLGCSCCCCVSRAVRAGAARAVFGDGLELQLSGPLSNLVPPVQFLSGKSSSGQTRQSCSLCSRAQAPSSWASLWEEMCAAMQSLQSCSLDESVLLRAVEGGAHPCARSWQDSFLSAHSMCSVSAPCSNLSALAAFGLCLRSQSSPSLKAFGGQTSLLGTRNESV